MSAPALQPIDDEPKFKRRVAHNFFVRIHMSLLVAAVISSGVLASKLLMHLGVSLGIRYPLAVLVSYAVFLLLVRIWIWYVSIRCGAATSLGNLTFDGGGSLDFGRAGGSGGGGFRGFGGGSSGGGGASSSWEANPSAALVPPSSGTTSSGSGWLPDLDLGSCDGDGWWIILLLVALVVCIFGGGVYLVWMAPQILPEAAAQVILAGTLSRASRAHHNDWMGGVVRSTCIPFLIVMLAAGVLGWKAHRYCPEARRLVEIFSCPSRI